MKILLEIYQTDKSGLALLNSRWFEREKRIDNPLYNILIDFDLHDPAFGYICVYRSKIDVVSSTTETILKEIVKKVNSNTFTDFHSRPITISDVIRIDEKLFFVDDNDFKHISSKSLESRKE